MKRAVSISIGSSKRDSLFETELLGQQVRLERIGTDGDMARAAQMYRSLDGQVAAFGVGGTDLGLMVDGRWYPLHSVQSLVRDVRKTPVADGTGLKVTLEKQAAQVIDAHPQAAPQSRRALLMSGVDRFGLLRSFTNAGYETLIGDLMFTIGFPVAIHSERSLKRLARLLIPIISRLPFEWVYPTGEKQEERKPKYTQAFQWASVIAGDCHYITRYMPDDMEGKIIVTNTTTPADRDLFRRCGVKYLVTTTPMLGDRTFGTNVLEAALLAARGYQGVVDYAHPGDYFVEMEKTLQALNLRPQFQEI